MTERENSLRTRQRRSIITEKDFNDFLGICQKQGVDAAVVELKIAKSSVQRMAIEMCLHWYRMNGELSKTPLVSSENPSLAASTSLLPRSLPQ